MTSSKKWLKIRFGRQARELEMLMKFHTWETKGFFLLAKDMILAGK